MQSSITARGRGYRWRRSFLVAGLLMAAAAALPLAATGSTAATGGGLGSVSLPDAPASGLGTLDLTSARPAASTFDGLAAAASREGSVRVIVGLRTTFTPEGLLSESERRAQRARIASAGDRLLAALAGSDHAVAHKYDAVPYVALTLSPGALNALRRSGLAATIQEDTLDVAFLASTTPIVESTEAGILRRTGSGRRVAVLDTGVDKDHPFIGTTQADNEACFSLGSDGVAGAGNCPNGLSTMTGPGAGENCTYSAADCPHGTHVAGIAMGGPGGGISASGTARSAKVIPVQVFSNFAGSARAFVSDQLAGLNYIFGLPASVRNTVSAVNMSLGGSTIFTTPCDTDSRKAAIDNLLSVGIATAIASGNGGSNTGVSAPGCISTAVTVGATTDADTVASFSNSSALVDLLAPGVSVDSSVPDADPSPGSPGPFANFDGTSMATPHVAGAFADLDALAPTASVATLLSHLQATGKPVTDPDNGVTERRIRILSASTRISDTGFKKGAAHSGPGFGLASNGTGLATRAGGPAASTITISGIPLGATTQKVYLYWNTIGGPDASAVFQGLSRKGTLIGASGDTCWNINQLGANRIYRSTLPNSAVPGNGTYTISGVGGPLGSDGTGASLVVVFQDPAFPGLTGKVVINNGAMSADFDPEDTMSTTFAVSSATPTTSADLHVGIGDGQAAFGENPLLWNGAPVTAANAFFGSDGAMWDDYTLSVPPASIPTGAAVKRTASLTSVNDCLDWAYAAVNWSFVTPVG